MTDQSIEGFFLAGLEFGNHLRISSQNCVNSGLNGTGVRNLLQAECFDKGVDIVAFLFPNRREDRTSALLVERSIALVKAYNAGTAVFMVEGLQLIIAILLMVLGLIIVVQSGKVLFKKSSEK